jgi:hypothetical protein
MPKAPICINYGCGSPRAKLNEKRYRPVCGHCHHAGYGKHPLKEGVTPFKTGICSNKDGHLGFPCPTNYKKAKWAKGITQLDHIDGNRHNNEPENFQELCPMCHHYKGRLEGDFKRQPKRNT